MATPLSQAEAKRPAAAEPRLAGLIHEQFGFVWRLLRRIGIPESDADEAAQQVFVAVSQRIDDIRPGSERAFLFGTALHVGSRARGGLARKREDFRADFHEQPDCTPSLEELVDRRRARALLDTLLEEMPLELRVVFVLYEIEQLTSAEIAEVVGVPLGTVASRLRRAREDFTARVARVEARGKSAGPMTDDPVRLLDDGGSQLLRTLISAAREEEPKPAVLQRTLVAVGVGTALTTAAASASGARASGGSAGTTGVVGGAALGTAKRAASSTALVITTWLAVGALTGTLASSALYHVSGALTSELPASSSSAALIQATSAAPAPPAVVAALPRAVDPAASLPKVDLGTPLAAEVAALDGARQALGAGNAARTLDLIDGYETRFPEARMLPDALYLRVEAFTLKGDKSSAEAVARRILRVYPSSPQAARARTVLGLDK